MARTRPTAAVSRLLETALYVEDVSAVSRFYREVLGFAFLRGGDPDSHGPNEPVFMALAVPGGTVLLLFQTGRFTTPMRLPGGTIPPHDGRGQLHLAFAIDAAQLSAWRARLAEAGVPIEGEVRWARGGSSLYFRDPAGNLVELATPGLWETY
jgi:catechol 2,3-dioxygenase-like lactoylglutathione lyase family enzyme